MLTPDAEGEFALPRLARRQRQHRLAVRTDRPGAGKIVRRDDDRRDAVAAAGRARGILVVLAARQCLDPGLAGVEAAGKVAQQIERLGQDMFARHRLEFGHVERGQNGAQRQHARRLRRAVLSRRRLDGVAGVEQHGAALFHVGVDPVEGVLRRFFGPRHDRPVDQREERQFVMRGIDADGVAGFQRRALREEQRQSGHAGLDDGIDVGIAGDDIGEPGLRGGLDGEIVARFGARRPGGYQCRGQHRCAHDRERQCSRRRAPPQQRRDTGAEHGDDHGVDQEQGQRRRQQDPAQVARFGVGVGGVARAQARGVERRDAIGSRQRVDRERAVGRAVEAGRMIRRRAVAEVGGQRLGGRGRRPERAETVEDMQRRHRFRGGFAGDARARFGGVAGHVDDPPQHLDEGAGHRQIGPAHIGADMKQGHDTLAAMFAGHQRRSIFQRGPAFRRQHRIRLGEHLAVDGDVLRHRQTGERSVGGKGGQVLRLFPGQAAAEAAAAAAQFHRHQIVIGLRQARPGKAHQHAALLDPGADTFADFGRQRSDVGQHHHRQLLVEELRDHLLRRALVAEPHIGERRQRAGEIEGRCQ